MEPACQRADQRRSGHPLARRRVDQGDVELGTIAPLLEKLRAYAISINADRELAADVVAMVGEPENVKPVTETMQAFDRGKDTFPRQPSRRRMQDRFVRLANGHLALSPYA